MGWWKVSKKMYRSVTQHHTGKMNEEWRKRELACGTKRKSLGRCSLSALSSALLSLRLCLSCPPALSQLSRLGWGSCLVLSFPFQIKDPPHSGAITKPIKLTQSHTIKGQSRDVACLGQEWLSAKWQQQVQTRESRTASTCNSTHPRKERHYKRR